MRGHRIDYDLWAKDFDLADWEFKNCLPYFIAGENRECLEDKGFAIQPWTAVRFENACLILEKNRALAMGNYYFTDLDGNETKVEYTFGYKIVDDLIKIDLHHSSFPFSRDK